MAKVRVSYPGFVNEWFGLAAVSVSDYVTRLYNVILHTNIRRLFVLHIHVRILLTDCV